MYIVIVSKFINNYVVQLLGGTQYSYGLHPSCNLCNAAPECTRIAETHPTAVPGYTRE